MAKSKNEKSVKRGKPTIPKDYLLAVSDRIHKTSPTVEIIYNTVRAVWSDGYGRGYLRCLNDQKVFRDARKRRIKQTFDNIKTNIDDEIHNKNSK